ncbi:hypothetical protein NKG05_23365 [Oerskovia sp. M15]
MAQAEPGPLIILVTGTALAFAITALTSGLKNRRALGASLSTVVLGLALYYPLQALFKSVPFTWWIVLGLAVLAVVVGIVVGILWGGPDKGSPPVRQGSRPSSSRA